MTVVAQSRSQTNPRVRIGPGPMSYGAGGAVRSTGGIPTGTIVGTMRRSRSGAGATEVLATLMGRVLAGVGSIGRTKGTGTIPSGSGGAVATMSLAVAITPPVMITL